MSQASPSHRVRVAQLPTGDSLNRALVFPTSHEVIKHAAISFFEGMDEPSRCAVCSTVQARGFEAFRRARILEGMDLRLLVNRQDPPGIGVSPLSIRDRDRPA